MAASTRFLNKPWNADKVSPKTLKKKHKVIPKDANHEDGPEGEAWKKASLSGPSDYDAVVREATTGVFFVFSWQESNHSAPNGKSFG
ncbi:hypothetical protein [Paraprevotella xylaniphila]|uniref:hypothetical protein n=1 Tax=Paraprevotella xylaniphila TaxID=454155 RepID=UPI002666656D|nr:hypothetical protein [Paraprevotella xylaniphila]